MTLGLARDSVTKTKNDAYIVHVLVSSVLVCAACFLIFYEPFDAAEAVLPLLLEWWIVALSIRFVFAGERSKHLAFAACLVVISHFCSYLVARSYLDSYGTPHAGSDDSQYILLAEQVAYVLRSQPGAFYDAWMNMAIDWSLGGWPYLLGCVTALVPSSVVNIHAVAIGLNAIGLATIYVALMRMLERQMGIPSGEVRKVVLLLSPELFFYAGSVLKDVLLVLAALLIYDVSCRLVAGVTRFSDISVAFFAMAYAATTRLVYVPLVVLPVLFWSLLRLFKLKAIPGIVIGLAIALVAAALYGPSMASMGLTRDYSLEQWMVGAGVEAAEGTGWSGIIERIPYVGRAIRWMLSPPPLNPLTVDWSSWTTYPYAIRSLGTLLGLYLVAATLMTGKLADKLRTPLFNTAMGSYLAIQVASAAIAADARYKLTALPFIGVAYALSRDRFFLRGHVKP